jgi:hypothetical protein
LLVVAGELRVVDVARFGDVYGTGNGLSGRVTEPRILREDRRPELSGVDVGEELTERLRAELLIDHAEVPQAGHHLLAVIVLLFLDHQAAGVDVASHPALVRRADVLWPVEPVVVGLWKPVDVQCLGARPRQLQADGAADNARADDDCVVLSGHPASFSRGRRARRSVRVVVR